MAESFFHSYKIEDRSHLAFIKREIHNLLNEAGFGSKRTAEIDIVVSELTSNLVKYAGRGELLYRLSNSNQDNRKFEIFCLDDGPGTNEILKFMKDGASTANTLGHGLGSMNRLSNAFQIFSMKDWGTVVYAKALQNTETILPRKTFEYEVLQACAPGEVVCGDGYQVIMNPNEIRIFVGDGLGHGPHAREAVQEAIAAFKECTSPDPVEVIGYIHQRVKRTRGLVGTVALLNRETGIWRMCGVGNIATRIYDGLMARNYMPHNGIIGHNISRSMHPFTIEKDKFQWLVMASDGLKSRWELAKYTSILKYSPALMAGVLFKDFARRNDDMTVLVARMNN